MAPCGAFTHPVEYVMTGLCTCCKCPDCSMKRLRGFDMTVLALGEEYALERWIGRN